MYILGLKGLKELLRIYKLSLLLNEYGDPTFISKFKFTVSFSEELPCDPGGTHLRRKFIRG